MNKLLTLLLILGMPLALRANDYGIAFDNANRLYEDGRFADAATAYEALMQTGNLSESLLFNRGNALFRQGKLGLAIACYRQALLLSPRDKDARANLQFARTQARGGAPFQINRWNDGLSRLSLNEWTALAAFALWLCFILLALAQWRKELAVALRKYIVIAGAAFLLLAVCLGIELQLNYFATTAIVIAGETDVRQGPFDEAPSVYKVRDGVELDVLDHKDNWLEVSDSAQRIGWVKKDQVLVFHPATLDRS